MNIKKSVKKIILSPLLYTSIMSLVSYVALAKLLQIPFYNITSLLLFILLFLLYSKTDYQNKKYRKDGAILSAVFSFLFILGSTIQEGLNNPDVSFLNELFTLKKLCFFWGICFLLLTILMHILPFIDTLKIKAYQMVPKKTIRTTFLASFLIIFICWLPYYLVYFPGGVSPDSVDGFTIIMGNFSDISDHHPLLHTVFMAIPYSIGMFLFNNITLAVALVAFVQMLIMAAIFAYAVIFIYERTSNKSLAYGSMLFFALCPMFGHYSITMWKDVIFGGLMLLFTIATIRIFEKKELFTFKSLLSFSILSLLTVFFRNNAIYMYAIFACISFIIFRKQWKKITLMFLAIFSVYFIVKGPIFNLLNVQKSASAEYLAIPLQQMGRMAYKNADFTEEEKQLLEPLISTEDLKKLYNPIVVDDIKFDDTYHGEVFDENKFVYLKLWAQLVVKHPVVAVEGYLSSTLGYWYPNVNYWSIQDGVVNNEIGIEGKLLQVPFLEKLINTIEKREIPLIGMVWSIGLTMWILSFFAYLTWKRGGLRKLYPFVPILGIWLTMMAAAPVYAEFRYMFSAYTVLPVLVIYAITIDNKRDREKGVDYAKKRK